MKPIILVIGGVVLVIVIYFLSPLIFARRVTFVLPADFRGLIRVYSASAATPSFRGEVEVPVGGEIPASDITGKDEVQHIKARWRSGSELEIKPIGDQTPEKTFLWILSYPPKPAEYYYFVGTLAELKEFWAANYNRLYAVPTK